MAVTFDATSNSGIQSAVSSFSWSHTCSGSDRVLIVCVSLLDDAGVAPTVTAVTYAGVSLTNIQNNSGSINGSLHVRTSIWRLIAPATGANTVAVTLSSAVADSILGGAVSVTGAHQTTPETVTGGTNDRIGFTDISTTIASTVNDLCVDCFIGWFGDAAVAMTGQTERWNLDSGVNTTGHGGSTEPGAASVTMGWQGMNTNDLMCHSMVSIAQAAAAADVLQDVIGVGLVPFPR